MDGAEFYRDAEYNVWSVSSILASGDDPLVEYGEFFPTLSLT